MSHVHVHILPRKVDDLQKSSDKVDALDEVGLHVWWKICSCQCVKCFLPCLTFVFSQECQLKKRLDAEAQRKDRTREEMLEEATELRKLF